MPKKQVEIIPNEALVVRGGRIVQKILNVP
jgi:hypothetical protein